MRARTPGQVMVLGVVTMLILALSLMLSFNMTQAIHEKIRIQQHSDATAYSIATMEARAMNYVAYTNRTMAAAYVSMMTAHAYLSAAGLTVNILKAGKINFIIIAIQEFLQSFCPYPCTCSQHCTDMSDAFQISQDYGDAADDYEDKVKGHCGDLNDAIKDLGDLINTLHKNEQAAVAAAAKYAKGDGLFLKEKNAPLASELASGAGNENVGSFACALEGAKDLECQGSPASSPQERSTVMGNVANAARPGFPRDRVPMMPRVLSDKFLNDKLDDLQGNEGSHQPITFGGGCGRVSASPSDCDGAGQDDEGKAVAARDKGGIFMNQWRDGAMVMPFSDSNVGSDDQGGDHNPAHEDDHGEFKPIQPQDVCSSDGNCFINFRSNDDEKKDYGQPHVYGAITQDLRLTPRNQRAIWEINEGGSVTMNNGARGDATLRLVPERNGFAISKALVYFHRFDTWKAPPTLFDAYWRAKLHPFNDTDEMQEALGKAGYPDRDALGGNMPVEGKR